MTQNDSNSFKRCWKEIKQSQPSAKKGQTSHHGIVISASGSRDCHLGPQVRISLLGIPTEVVSLTQRSRSPYSSHLQPLHSAKGSSTWRHQPGLRRPACEATAHGPQV